MATFYYVWSICLVQGSVSVWHFCDPEVNVESELAKIPFFVFCFSSGILLAWESSWPVIAPAGVFITSNSCLMCCSLPLHSACDMCLCCHSNSVCVRLPHFFFLLHTPSTCPFTPASFPGEMLMFNGFLFHCCFPIFKKINKNELTFKIFFVSQNER